MSSRYVGPKLPGKAGIVQKAMDFAISKISRKKKVSPDIKSVSPTKDIAGSEKRVKGAEYLKRIDATTKSKSKIDTGKKMMREGQKELRKMIDTKRAFKFKHGTTRQKTFPIKPGKDPKKEHKGLVEEKATGGRVGRKFGSPKPKTNVEKIKETFAPKGLKKIDPKKQKGLAKLKKARPDVVRKMGYFKRGGRS